MKFLSVVVMLIGALSFAHSGKHKKSHHTHHGAHVHGHATMALAFEGTKGTVEFKSPAESIVGFEHTPKSEADQKAVTEAQTKFESGIAQTIQLDPASKCIFNKEKVELVSEKNAKHSDFVAQYQVQCQNPVMGKTITFDFSKFEKLNKVEITVLADDLQKTATAKKQPVQIELK